MARMLNRKPLGKLRGVDPKDRRRSWINAYEATIWKLTDTDDKGEAKYVDFDVRMADGKSLLDHSDLYRTAKELLFWIRAGSYARVDDAQRHWQYGQFLLRLCYGLTARGFYSFSSLKPTDIDLICEDAAFGIDGLTRSSRIASEGLEQFKNWAEVPTSIRRGKSLLHVAVKHAFKLPMTWAAAEIKSEINVAEARLNGKFLVSLAASKEEPITSSLINIVTRLFEAQFALRDFIEASTIAFRPFPEGAANRAFKLGRGTTRTPVPPSELALRLLENTTRYFADHHEHILKAYQSGLKMRGTQKWSLTRSLEVGVQVRSLSVACFILIAAFTARRTDEIKLLERNCLHGNDEAGYWLRVYIEKTERELTWIPIPTLVAQAVTTLRSLVPDEECDPDSALFQYKSPRSGNVTPLSPEENLNKFADSINACEFANENQSITKNVLNGSSTDSKSSEGNAKWYWQPRQFRRLFAVIFFYRYKGKIETLAHHLRHFDSRMTNDYVTKDPEIAKVWDQEVWRHQVEIARDIVSGRTTYSGAMGKRLTKLVERLRKKFSDKINVVPETFEAALLRQLRKGQFVLRPKLWVTCSCPNSRKACEKAACRKAAGYCGDDHGPDFAAAGPTVCPGCPFAMIGPDNIVYIDQHLERAKASAKAATADGPTIFAELQAANVLKLTSVVKDLKSA